MLALKPGDGRGFDLRHLMRHTHTHTQREREREREIPCDYMEKRGGEINRKIRTLNKCISGRTKK